MSTPNLMMSNAAATTSSRVNGPDTGNLSGDVAMEAANVAGSATFAGLLENYLLDTATQTIQNIPPSSSENLVFASLQQYETPVDGNDLPPGGNPVAWSALMIMETPDSLTPVGQVSVSPMLTSDGRSPGLITEEPLVNQVATSEMKLAYQGKTPDEFLVEVFNASAKAGLLQPERATAEPTPAPINDAQQLNQASGIVSNPVIQRNAMPVATGMAETSLPNMPVPPQNPEWGTAIGERLQWMVSQKINQAEIRLDPPELGSLEVKVVVQKDSAHVNFSSQHASVRDAVEDAMPRLREMFSSVGLSLGDVNVSQESFQQQMSEGQENNPNQGHSSEEDSSITAENGNDGGGIHRQGTGLLDTYV